ncbi:D-alanyl-D-alanine carboxypeptidase/D-alanyl-D-alanine-endopeptidase [Desulfobulbus alkaliphilus]|uniref:D-alanyl-D-alanine carboxypeptidase/D-alanyl-D-alanine-endopeptidase n=1 Tax=Desulfobulbus alkaliphilus TaxID=869814 RepID=UPI001964480C|nr:D-alanyl-D-alanine carboxypeptidase [Desulfobulbus alkaliphilus]MBM9536427.1 D-alanyl-D-alanine carboxypeptidase [Desulfobulbus alkaliphilus]
MKLALLPEERSLCPLRVHDCASRYRQRQVVVLALCLMLLVVFPGGGLSGHAACQALANTQGKNAYGVADRDGRMIDACNPDLPLIPASVLKIGTALAAHHILGDDYRFRTEFYVDHRDNLFIKGFGDPMLVTEEMAFIVEQLHRSGLRRVRTLYVDSSAFALTDQVPGRGGSTNPYDAPVGPLSVNFNTAYLAVDAEGGIHSAEPQTPTLPLFRELAQGLSPGLHRINICGSGPCDLETRMAQYGGELLHNLLDKAGIPVVAVGGLQKVPPDDQVRLLYRHYSTWSLAEINVAMLEYSSNVIANLLFLACGAQRYGYPATWEKARQAVSMEITHLVGQERAAGLNQEEGSGLSRRNRVTVRTMLSLLEAFRPYTDLLRQQGKVSMKTGTMTGVAAAAGYLTNGRAFVILLNESTNDRSALVQRLEGWYGESNSAE